MTIRSGGRPRDPRDARQQAPRPYSPDAYATEYDPDELEVPRRGRNGYRHEGGGGSGLLGIVKFLVFTLVLAGIVLTIALTALRPMVNSALLSWAADSPAALNMPFVRDLVREELGDALTEPVSDDPEQIGFVVTEGDNASTIADRLEREGFIRDARAFVFIATERELASSLQQGDFILRRNLTPDELVTALLAPPTIPYVDIAFRTGLRLEQLTAKLQTVEGLEMDVREFYELVKEPPAGLIADYDWLQTALADAPDGASLEGFLWPATYRILPDSTPEELVRLMLEAWIAAVGDARLDVPEGRGLTFYQVLTLASIVEREAVLDEEKPLIAGVYQNRIDRIAGVRPGLLNADPSNIWAQDTLNLAEQDFETWQQYTFWTVPEPAMADVAVDTELFPYNTYAVPGLPPTPIATPTLLSIDAALEPDTEEKYIYFLAIPEGGGAHVFAKNKAQHDRNRAEYGYT